MRASSHNILNVPGSAPVRGTCWACAATPEDSVNSETISGAGFASVATSEPASTGFSGTTEGLGAGMAPSAFTAASATSERFRLVTACM